MTDLVPITGCNASVALDPNDGKADSALVKIGLRGIGRSFYGGAVENLGLAPMGKGHNNAGEPFDVESACYLKPLFAEYDKARRDGLRRKFVLKAGVKTVKSFTGEVCAADHVCNGNGDAAIYFGSESAAESTSSTRILDFYRGIPRFRAKMDTIRSRFDETMGALKFPDKTLFILSANLGNTQQKNLGFALLQDAFVTGTSGMIRELIARTTQYPDAIVFLESQGGEKGFDFDTEYEDTDQRELHVRCATCGESHIFNWKVFDEGCMTRPDDFEATLPRSKIEELTAEARRRGVSDSDSDSASLRLCGEELSARLKGRVAGFQRGADEIIKKNDGTYNEAAILRETHFECFHCGSRWDDTPELREHLDQTSHFVAARTDALAQNIGFNIPQWINRRLCFANGNGWGYMMVEKLKAQKIASELGNFQPLKQWWQKTAARTWDNDINAKTPEKLGATIYDIDPKLKYPGELVRISGTDCQLNLTHLIYQSWAIGDGTKPRLMHYEWVKPPAAGWSDEEARKFCKARVRQLDKEWGIEHQNSMKDCAHRPDLVREWAAEDAVFAKIRIGGRITNKWVSYGLLIGDEKVSYKWKNPGRADTLERFKQFEFVNVDIVKDGKRQRIPVHHRLWSNPSIKEIAERWRDGDGAPKIEVHEKFLKPVPGSNDKESFWSQMTSERKLPWKNRPGKFRYDNEGRPNHAWDGFCMVLVRMDELGYLNSFGPPEAEPDQT